MAIDREAPGGSDRPISLRAGRPSVVRLSRRVLIGAAAAAALAVAGVVGWGLLARPPTASGLAEFSTAPPPPERLNALPKDYAAAGDIPKLGPPLPGDLGRPVLSAQTALPAASSATAASATGSALDQERQAARTSHLFGPTGQASVAASVLAAPALPITEAGSPTSPRTGGGLLDQPPDRRTVSPDRLTTPASPYALQAGAVIPAALITGIRSDLPGAVTAQVTEDVYDSVSGRYRLVPAGSRLVGRYESQVSFGQSRVQLVWTRLLLPNGRSVALENLPGGDASGFSGLQDEVDHHWRALFAAAAVTSLLSVGTEVQSTGSETDLAMALRRAGADSANQVGQQVVGKTLSIPPTLTIRPGAAVRVILNRDLVLEPYGA
ncbi:TrbI/VirB10 family protein [Caulobacter sp. KR2-114]|uniref:TrbI/VirB10 family protein n=1 Tax=Caulobacter sp. KR2-114 TaxID=3400912 RepID=UPI003C127C0A